MTSWFRARSQKRGTAHRLQREPSFFGNPAAFTQPCVFRLDRYPIHSVAGCVPLTRPRAAGWLSVPVCRTALSSGWTSPSSRNFSSASGYAAVPRGVLQHPQPPELQCSRIRGQRSCCGLGCDQLHQLELRRNWFDSRCSLRSEADPVRFEALLLRDGFSSTKALSLERLPLPFGIELTANCVPRAVLT